MPQPYTVDDINAELARREAARKAAAGTPAVSSQPAATARPLPNTELAPAHMPAGGSESPASPTDSPRRSIWNSAADTVAGIGRSLGTGVSEALPKYALGVNKLLGLQAFEPTRRMFIDPLEQRLQAIQAREAQDTAGADTGEQIARGAARGAGNLVTLPLDIALGTVAKAGTLGAQAIEAAPRVASSLPELFRAIPDFALGMGIRKTGEEESIAGLPRGVAEGLAMHRAGELGKDMAFLPRAVAQVGAQGGLGAAMTTADTLEHEGRLPTGTELAVGAGTNAAMALPFVGAPGKMGVKREFTPELRKEFEGQLSGLLKNDQLSVLPDESLQQFQDVASKLSEIDPDNKTFLNGLLEIDQEQKRRSGGEPQGETLGAPEETPPAEQRPYSRAELAGLATGDLNSQDRLMEIADAYSIQNPHRMEPGALVDAIDKAESDRQAEAQRQAEAAKATSDMQAQAEQARNDILGAKDESGRLDAIKRFEDATRALAQAPALPAGQGFDLVPHEQRRDVQAGLAIQKEQLDTLNQTPALPQGQGFELVGGPKTITPEEARNLEAKPNVGPSEAGAAPVQSPPTAMQLELSQGQQPAREPMANEARNYLEKRSEGLQASIDNATQSGLEPDAKDVSERDAIGKMLADDNAARTSQQAQAAPGQQPTNPAQGEQQTTPEGFARAYGIPETPDFLDAIKTYQDLTGENSASRAEQTPQALASISDKEADSPFDETKIPDEVEHLWNQPHDFNLSDEDRKALDLWRKDQAKYLRLNPPIDPIYSLVRGRIDASSVSPDERKQLNGKFGRGIWAKAGKGLALDELEMEMRNNPQFGASLRDTYGSDNLFTYLIGPAKSNKRMMEEALHGLDSEYERLAEEIAAERVAQEGKPGIEESQTGLAEGGPGPSEETSDGNGIDYTDVPFSIPSPQKPLVSPLGKDGKPLFESLPKASSGGRGFAEVTPSEAGQGLQDSPAMKGAGKPVVESWLGPVRERLAEHVKLDVADRPEEIPADVQTKMVEDDPNWKERTGYTVDGKSYVFAWNIADKFEARQTVKHEVQHQITTAFFQREAAQEPHKGPAEKRMSEFLKSVIKTKRSEISDHMLRFYGKDFDPQSPMHWLIGASEWLAEARISEPTMYERYKATLVSMLREVGERLDIHWLRDMDMTDAELKAFNERLWKDALRQGKASDLLALPETPGRGEALASVTPAEAGASQGDMAQTGLARREPPAEPLGSGSVGVEGPMRTPGIVPVRVELPEMVRLTRNLLGKNPKVKERLSKAAASGLFRPNPDNPSLELRADIFIGPKLGEARTRNPREAEPIFIGAIAERTGLEPSDIQLKTQRGKDGWTIMRAYQPDPEHAGNVLAHEIGHLVDFLPDKDIARGNILGRLASLKGYMKSMIEGMPDTVADFITPAEREAMRKQVRDGYLDDVSMNRADFEADPELTEAIKGEIDKRYQEVLTAEIRRRGLVGKNEVMQELKAVSQWWKPFNENGDPGYTKYRYSSPELYADAFSVLLNDPAELKARAPRFYDSFQAWLVQKPEVKAAYQGIQDAIHSGQIYQDRVQALREGFRQADEARGLMYDETTDYKQWAKRAFVDTYAPVKAVLTGDDAAYKIHRAIYSGSEKELYVSEMHDRVTKRLDDAGLTPEDLGEYLFHQRVINERGQMANPHGFNPKASGERLEEMRTRTYTPQQAEALESAAKEFHQTRAELVTDKMTASGMFDSELMRHIQEASDYATFDVVKHIDDAFGPGIGAKIHKQVGTTEAVGNPYTATLSKDLSMLSSINWNLAKESVARDLLENHPDQITPAETRFNGKTMAPVDKTTDKIGTLYFMKDGKVQGYYVDRLVAEAFNRDRPEDLQALGRLLGTMATPFRMVFTTIRPGFQAFNAIRDFRAMYRNLPGSGDERGIIKSYLRALPEAWAAEFGMTPEIVKEMQHDNMLISVVDPMGLSKIDTEHDRLMRMYNLEPGAYQNTVWKPFMQLYGQALKLGGFLERIPKIAAYRYLKENFPEWSQDQIGEFIRTKAGSPAFLYKGSLSSVTNNLFLFSNAIVQGMRGDYSAMRENPNGWWWKWAKGTIGPKLIMRAALYGAFGAGVKTIMDGISDYDLSNYDVIPLGLDANGKSVYLRFPVDEMGRMTSSLLWKGMNLVDGQAPTKPADIFDFMAGQAPNVAPWFTVLGGVTSYLSGRNPYDAFHGREVIEPTVFKAGGLPSQEQMLKWIWNTSGGGLLYRFDNHEVDGVKSDLQKVVGLPVVNDFLGRFLKVSDYGLREKLRAAGEAEESKRSREVLETRTAMSKLLNGEELNEKDNVSLARDHKYVKQQYGRLLTKQQDNALTSALQAAGTQRDKSAVYREWDRIKGARETSLAN